MYIVMLPRAFTYGVKLKLSCALAKGKVEQYRLARDRLLRGEHFGGCALLGTVSGLSVGYWSWEYTPESLLAAYSSIG